MLRSSQPTKGRAWLRLAPPAVWLMRGLLAACWLLTAEALFWTNVSRPLWIWLPLALGYVAAAGLILDAAVRFRVRDLFGGALLGGLFALVSGAVLNPAYGLENLPVTLGTRVMGAHAVAGMLGLWLFLRLLDGLPSGRAWWGGVIVVGVFWGVWAQGIGALSGTDAPLLPLWSVALVGGACGLLVIGLAWGIQRVPLHDEDALRLSPLEYGLCSAVLVAWIAWGLFSGDLPRNGLSALILIASFALVVLWFQERPESVSVLVKRLPAQRINLLVALGALLVMIVLATALYALLPQIPAGERPTYLRGLGVLFGVFGLTWLPSVSLVLGVRAYRQTMRTGKML